MYVYTCMHTSTSPEAKCLRVNILALFLNEIKTHMFKWKFLASLIENSYVESLRPEASKLVTSKIYVIHLDLILYYSINDVANFDASGLRDST